MVQLVVLIQFYLFCLCSFFFNCSGKLFSSTTKCFFRDLIVRRSELASLLETSQFRKMSANSKQWLNGYEFSSHNCGGTVLYYYSSSFGSCEQKNDTSSYIVSEILLSNGNWSYTDTEYNTNSQCSGLPSQVVTGTFPQCSNNQNYSYGGYYTTNSIPSMPAGVLFRYMIIIMYDSNARIIQYIMV
jgi:hypothetical protein